MLNVFHIVNIVHWGLAATERVSAGGDAGQAGRARWRGLNTFRECVSARRPRSEEGSTEVTIPVVSI